MANLSRPLTVNLPTALHDVYDKAAASRLMSKSDVVREVLLAHVGTILAAPKRRKRALKIA